MASFSQPERRALQRTQLGTPSSPFIGEGGSGNVHPDADLLTAFAEHSLTTREHDHVLAHLAVCDSCRDVVALAGSPLVEPVPQPARKRGLWEIPLFHWGAVAATTVIVVTAVSLGVREYRTEAPQMSRLYKEQAPAMVAPKEDKVVAEPRAKAEPSSGPQESVPAAPVNATPPKRSLHLQQEARYERPANETAKKQEIDFSTNGKNISGNAVSAGAVADTRDRLDSANSNAVLKNKGADVSVARAVPVPPPPPAPATLAQNAPVSGASETVMVESGNSEGKTDQSASATAEIVPQAVVSEKIQGRSVAPLQKAARAQVSEFRWQIDDGKLQRSAAPNEWHTVVPNQTFRTFAVVQGQVWAGGDNGLLYHSPDNGQTWMPVSVRRGPTTLSGNIVEVRFADLQHGSVQTSTGEHWTTSDGGQSWQAK